MKQNNHSSSTSLETKVLQAIEEMKIELGETFSKGTVDAGIQPCLVKHSRWIGALSKLKIKQVRSLTWLVLR